MTPNLVTIYSILVQLIATSTDVDQASLSSGTQQLSWLGGGLASLGWLS